MKFTVEIDMENAAFEDPQELSRIVAKIAHRVEGEDNTQTYVSVSSPIFDINGNNVGRWELGDYS